MAKQKEKERRKREQAKEDKLLPEEHAVEPDQPKPLIPQDSQGAILRDVSDDANGEDNNYNPLSHFGGFRELRT